MSDKSSILGFIPKDKYLTWTYMLLLVASAGGMALDVFGMIGINIPLGGVFGLAGLCGLILALLGFFVFKEDFGTLEQAHFLYICALFALFFVIGAVVGASLYTSPMLAIAISFVLRVCGLLLIFTGFNSFKHGRSVTKDNIREEVQRALSRA